MRSASRSRTRRSGSRCGCAGDALWCDFSNIGLADAHWSDRWPQEGANDRGVGRPSTGAGDLGGCWPSDTKLDRTERWAQIARVLHGWGVHSRSASGFSVGCRTKGAAHGRPDLRGRSQLRPPHISDQAPEPHRNYLFFCLAPISALVLTPRIAGRPGRAGFCQTCSEPAMSAPAPTSGPEEVRTLEVNFESPVSGGCSNDLRFGLGPPGARQGRPPDTPKMSSKCLKVCLPCADFLCATPVI